MTAPTISVRCPRCQSVQLVAAHMAHVPQRCAVCQEVFGVPTPQPASVGAAPTPAAPYHPLPPHLAVPPTASLATDPVRPPQTPPSAYVTPVAHQADAAEASPGEEPDPPPSRLKGLLMRGALVVIVLSLTVIAATVPGLVNKWRQAPADPVQQPSDGVVIGPETMNAEPSDTSSEVVTVEARDSATSGEDLNWVDAARKSIQRQGVQVKILRCEYGDVFGRNARNEPVSAGPGEFLKIYLQVSNKHQNPVEYVSWYGNKFREETRDGRGKAIDAGLADIDGRDYPFQRFADVKTIQGQVTRRLLGPGEIVQDVLVFALPAAKGKGQEDLYLQLPAAAVHRAGWFDFKLTPDLWQR